MQNPPYNPLADRSLPPRLRIASLAIFERAAQLQGQSRGALDTTGALEQACIELDVPYLIVGEGGVA